MTRKAYRKGDALVEKARSSIRCIIRTGVLIVPTRGRRAEIELSRLSPGDYFGETVCSPGRRTGTIRAMTFTVVYEVGQAALAQLMRDRPSIAEEISVHYRGERSILQPE